MITLLVSLAMATQCTAIDGDNIRCGDENIRLIGIDAPELRACPKTRNCAPGDGRASKRSLEGLIAGKQLNIERVGKDRYGRTLAIVHAGKLNLSCAQVSAGQAIYVARWDRAGRIAACLP